MSTEGSLSNKLPAILCLDILLCRARFSFVRRSAKRGGEFICVIISLVRLNWTAWTRYTPSRYRYVHYDDGNEEEDDTGVDSGNTDRQQSGLWRLLRSVVVRCEKGISGVAWALVKMKAPSRVSPHLKVSWCSPFWELFSASRSVALETKPEQRQQTEKHRNYSVSCRSQLGLARRRWLSCTALHSNHRLVEGTLIKSTQLTIRNVYMSRIVIKVWVLISEFQFNWTLDDFYISVTAVTDNG